MSHNDELQAKVEDLFERGCKLVVETHRPPEEVLGLLWKWVVQLRDESRELKADAQVGVYRCGETGIRVRCGFRENRIQYETIGGDKGEVVVSRTLVTDGGQVAESVYEHDDRIESIAVHTDHGRMTMNRVHE